MTKTYFYNENCFDTMKHMQEKNYTVDMILTSPPYNTARTSKSQKSLDTYINRYDIHLDNMTDEEYCNWSVDLFDNFDKILKPNGVILYNMSYGTENPNVMWLFIGDLMRKTNFMIADCIIWKKSSALPNNVSSNKLTRIVEFVFVICRKSEYKTFNANKKITSQNSKGQNYYENVFNFITAPNNDGANKLNKATYFSDLCLQLMDIYAKEDYIIYDPFMGTGTTAVASVKYNNFQNNITCIGSELSEAQVQLSKDRINELNNNLFNC